MGATASWELVMVLGLFTAVICGLGMYVHTHRASESPDGVSGGTTRYCVECGREPDGRHWAAVYALPGVRAHGETETQAKARVSAMALRAIAERLDTHQIQAHSFCFYVSAGSAHAFAERDDGKDVPLHVHELERIAVAAFETKEDAARWLRSPHPLFGRLTPLQVAHSEEGSARVKEMLIAIKYGGVT